MRLRRLEPVLRRAFEGPCSCEPGSRLLVAVSGGADSTALLIGLARVAPEFGLELRAAHLHHGLRGSEADGDLAFVHALCARLSVPLVAARRDTQLLMRRRGLRGQAGLRTLRREFLSAAARRAGAQAIATAHTANDQLETLLLRLGRGTGLQGLGGMAPKAGRWVKPLLEATREDIEADLKRAREPWREDGSNRDPHYARNRIRHEVLPVWAQALGPGAPGRDRISTLARHAARVTAEARSARQALAARAARLVELHARRADGRIELDASTLARCPEAARQAAILTLWRAIAPRGLGLPSSHRTQLDRLVMGSHRTARVTLPGGWFGSRQGKVFGLDRNPFQFEVPAELSWE